VSTTATAVRRRPVIDAVPTTTIGCVSSVVPDGIGGGATTDQARRYRTRYFVVRFGPKNRGPTATRQIVGHRCSHHFSTAATSPPSRGRSPTAVLCATVPGSTVAVLRATVPDPTAVLGPAVPDGFRLRRSAVHDHQPQRLQPRGRSDVPTILCTRRTPTVSRAAIRDQIDIVICFRRPFQHRDHRRTDHGSTSRFQTATVHPASSSLPARVQTATVCRSRCSSPTRIQIRRSGHCAFLPVRPTTSHFGRRPQCRRLLVLDPSPRSGAVRPVQSTSRLCPTEIPSVHGATTAIPTTAATVLLRLSHHRTSATERRAAAARSVVCKEPVLVRHQVHHTDPVQGTVRLQIRVHTIPTITTTTTIWCNLQHPQIRQLNTG